MMETIYPKSDQLGETEYRPASMTYKQTVEVVAYDYDGQRFCVECAKEHDEIDCDRWHHDPYSVPAGGSVTRASMQSAEMAYHCANTDCGKEIPA